MKSFLIYTSYKVYIGHKCHVNYQNRVNIAYDKLYVNVGR